MPELPEVKIMSEYINTISKDKVFNYIGKSEVSKNPKIVKPFDNFSLYAEARGKELKITLKNGNESKSLIFLLGMSGCWEWCSELEKHMHFYFKCDDGFLAFKDVRRFGKWYYGDFSKERSPDPVIEFDAFCKHLKDSKNKKIFQKPIYQLMLDQDYFNGVGNYLRSEILYRVDIDPFQPANKVVENETFLKACKDICIESYMIGGGQLKDWKNPFKSDSITFVDWLKCYGKGEKMKDKDRTFWFNKKYL